MEAQSGWYLVFTKPNHERIAETHLVRQGFQIYFPLLQQHKRRRSQYEVVTEPLFPRYLFINLETDKNDWSKIRSTRGCISLVRFGGLPAKVPNLLIDKLKADEPNREVLSQKNSSYFKPGDKVQVIDGLLIDYQGVIEKQNSQDRVTLLLSIAEGHTRSVNLSIHQIKLAG